MSAKLASLTDYLIGLNFVPRENLESCVDLCTVTPASINMGHYYELCKQHHRCTLLIERYTGDSRLIIAWIAAWLKDHDPDRDNDRLPDPDIDIKALDASGTQWNVDVSIEFIEPVLIQPDDANGTIMWNGSQWSLIDHPVCDTAEELDRLEPVEDEEQHQVNGRKLAVRTFS